MESLPDLNCLSVADKDALIGELWPLRALVVDLSAQVADLTARVTELQGRLAKNSRNSSKPPSSDGLNKPKPKSLRPVGEKSTGGQAGHAGHTLKRVASPDRIETHAPASHCDVCQRPLSTAVVVETRQVFDLPPLRCEVTEHQVLQTQCTCGKVHLGRFPAAVTAPVQYGPRSKAAVVQLTHHHMLPLARTGELMGDLFGLPMSDATVLAIQAEAQVRLAPTVAAMGEALTAAPVAHADETGMRVAGKIHWLHVLVTPLLTWLGEHPKRGRQAFDAFGLLMVFAGTLIHDGWKPYRELACQHGLCNAHHLRELTYVFEQLGQAWAKCLIDLLVAACHEVAATGAPLPAGRIAHYREAYDRILTTGEAANPRAPPSGKRGRTKQSKALNLIDRLRLYADDVWRFMTDAGVPFTNNLGEQAIRMPKVKQKVSGGFRTAGGLETFCTIRSYLATLHKQGMNLFTALTLTFQGAPPQPRFE
ncbi:MAG: IS66 family transposase [Chromatiaceae bacterium]|nr:IS66 family transposase [Chromatiaceae bacterium]